MFSFSWPPFASDTFISHPDYSHYLFFLLSSFPSPNWFYQLGTFSSYIILTCSKLAFRLLKDKTLSWFKILTDPAVESKPVLPHWMCTLCSKSNVCKDTPDRSHAVPIICLSSCCPPGELCISFLLSESFCLSILKLPPQWDFSDHPKNPSYPILFGFCVLPDLRYPFILSSIYNISLIFYSGPSWCAVWDCSSKWVLVIMKIIFLRLCWSYSSKSIISILMSGILFQACIT